MINELPTLYEVVAEKQQEQRSTTQRNGNKSKPTGNMPKSQSSGHQPKRVLMTPTPPPKEESDSDEEDAEEQGSTFCGSCGQDTGVDEFWICCDVCERWFHGKCVQVTPAKAKHINQYKCPSCSNKKARVH